MTVWNAPDDIHGAGARRCCPASPSGGARRGGTSSADAVTNVVLVFNAWSSRRTLACVRRRGPR
jgi:hypothetical protein